MKKLLTTLIALLFLVVALMFVSPYYALYRFKVAYEAGDYAPIINAIDYDTLRPSLKDEFHRQAKGALNHQGLAAVLPLLGVKEGKLDDIAKRFIDTAIDGAITPQNLSALAHGEVHKDSEPLAVLLVLWLGVEVLDMSAFIQDYLTTGDIHIAVANQQNSLKKHALTLQPVAPTLSYCGVNCFLIETAIKGKSVHIIMTRHQLVRWQISKIVLP